MKKIERMLRESHELDVPPSLRNDILERTANMMPSKEKKSPSPKKRIRRLAPVLACLAFIIISIGVLSALGFESYQTVYIDVNPSVAITLNRFGTVNDVEYFNNDAREALKHTSLNGKSAQQALEQIISAYDSEGYFGSEAEVLISVVSKNEKKGKALLDKLEKHATSMKEGKKYSVSASIHTKQDKEIAQGEGLSVGKYHLICEIIEYDSSYTIIELRDKSVSELRKILKSYEKQ